VFPLKFFDGAGSPVECKGIGAHKGIEILSLSNPLQCELLRYSGRSFFELNVLCLFRNEVEVRAGLAELTAAFL